MTARGASGELLKAERPSDRLPQPIPREPDHSCVKSVGRLKIEIGTSGSTSWVTRDHQAGCLKARSLRHDPDGNLTVAVINTTGGLTGGDSLTQVLRWHDQSRACVTTPAAEKIYRSAGGNALVRTELHVANGAFAEWLPQETILFDGGRLERNLDIHLDSSARLVACDAIVFGRLARGERLGPGYMADTLKVWRDGRLVLFDRTVIEGSLHDWLDGESTGRGNRASGMVLIACAAPERLLPHVRDALAQTSSLSGASLVRGLIHVRLLAADDAKLRRVMIRVLEVARAGRPLPRNWSC